MIFKYKRLDTEQDKSLPELEEDAIPIHEIKRGKGTNSDLPSFKVYFMVVVFGSLVVLPYYITHTLKILSLIGSVNEEVQHLTPQSSHYQDFVNKFGNEKDFVSNGLHKETFSTLSTELQDEDIENKTLENEDNPKPYPEMPTADQCDRVPVNFRFDCHPDGFFLTPEKCQERGCCWREVTVDELPPTKNFSSQLKPSNFNEINGTSEDNFGIPFCFYPSAYFLYNVTDVEYRDDQIKGSMKLSRKSGFPKDVEDLDILVIYETCTRVRIRILDANHRRWETPLPIVPKKTPGCCGTTMYQVKIVEHNAGFVVYRRDNDIPLFDTRKAAPMIFSDQFIQISTLLPSSYVYGLGQHLDGLLLGTNWRRRVLWNADGIPNPRENLYGSHPFYMVMEHSGSAHGVFFLNSNAIEVLLQPTPALTFRTLGGILDMYVFLGPSPDDVVSQYTEVIGRPFLPPYWSLGYHQCRFGYKNLEDMKKVWKRTRDAGIPFDVQWNDIDYMTERNDFTVNNDTFKELPEFVNELHKLGMHYVVIIDSGISAGETPGKYLPYDMGLKDDIFVKNSTNQIFIGKVWNRKSTVFPDFTALNAIIYWSFLIKNLRLELPFDGLWIDMNEPANFYNGQKDGCPLNSPFEHPFYIPPLKFTGALYDKTLCMTAKHYLGSHYNVHNLYGFTEVISTFKSLRMIKETSKPFIISRSSFPGMGAFGGHWTGDVKSDWFNLWKSIGDVLTMNILGIPMVGADICGFNGNTTVALCNRWMQLGAFYPFARNHNTDDGIDQDPVALGDLVVKSSKKALQQRYTLLPYLFSLFIMAHRTGIPVAKPLFFKYPHDTETYSIDTQFMWGEGLMIIPVLKENSTSVIAYFPSGRWYDWYGGKIVSKFGKQYLELPSPLDTIPLSISGGSILPCQTPNVTTTSSRLNPFGLVAALNEEGAAMGEMYWNRPEEPGHGYWKFSAITNFIISSPEIKNPTNDSLTLGWVKVYGVEQKVSMVIVNDVKTKFKYNAVDRVLEVDGLSVNFKKSVTLFYT